MLWFPGWHHACIFYLKRSILCLRNTNRVRIVQASHPLQRSCCITWTFWPVLKNKSQVSHLLCSSGRLPRGERRRWSWSWTDSSHETEILYREITFVLLVLDGCKPNLLDARFRSPTFLFLPTLVCLKDHSKSTELILWKGEVQTRHIYSIINDYLAQFGSESCYY